MRARPGAWTFGLALATLIVACQQLLSIEGTVTVPGDACGLPASGACRTCVASSCCAQAAACAADPSCNAYEKCQLACGSDYTCRARCLETTGVSAGEQVPALDQCIVAHCEEPCGVSCGATGSFAGSDAAASCQDCVANRACPAAEVCGSSIDCQELGHCALACFTNDCAEACIAAHPDASAAFNSLIIGVASYCLAACDVGNAWECSGKVNWPLPKSKDITLTVKLSIAGSTVNLGGLKVKACDPADTNCAGTQLGMVATTDALGTATIQLPHLASIIGPMVYVEVSGAGIPTTLFFLPFPLSEPNATIGLFLLSQASLDNLVASVVVPGADGGTTPFMPDLTRGTVAVAAQDCFRNPAQRVSIDALEGTDPATVRRYLLQGPILSNDAVLTDRLGIALFLNAPPNNRLRFTVTPASLGGVVTSRLTLFARPNTLSVVEAVPTP